MEALKDHLLDELAEARVQDSPNDELPVLSAIVRSGNPSIIRSHRLGHKVLDELETLRLVPAAAPQAEADPLVPPSIVVDGFSLQDELTICLDHTVDFDQPDYATGIEANFSHRDEEATLSDDELELMVEALIDRHVSDLRRDIGTLLATARRRR